MSGFVTLVGAGPGDPGLLTLKGREALGEAQVVVFDRLVSQEILNLIPADAERIDVGKEASHHKVPQDQINRILLEKALEGKRVVRLKGGDPFLFGRGGEELELLREHGVPFAEVPGITSAIAAPAYGGIPVTHRDYCSSVHIITGHARAGKALEIDFEALVRTGGTLVFLMGVSALPHITRGLLEAGMAPETPAAMVENGTTPMQRRLDATLATLTERAAEMGIHSPAVIVVGKVCALAEGFCWLDRLPLRGKRILVTRPKERAGTLSRKLRALGAEVTEYPCIETVPILPNPPLERELEAISGYEWLCLTSPAGVRYLWEALERLGKDARALGGVKLAAIGSGTAGALAEHGLRADFVPPVYDAAHLGQGLGALATGRVLILRAREGSQALTQALEAAHVSYTDCPTYETVYENPHSEALVKALDTFDFVTFTSASTVKGFVASVGQDVDFSRITGLCIGSQTAREAARHHIPTLVAEAATIDALTELACRAAPMCPPLRTGNGSFPEPEKWMKARDFPDYS
ncbi:MAG: uroporphyrinogen-III C-methyltransferase [Candidatus Faecousia sp.]|nr:uroporphyrinogen-III C-methyltransferase [Clostridiales bacterium]MDY4220751.1 uroporphyrinogen-III C-methyltransferase [Candidatus Faecousia sp.]